jgi:hypothetical protein
MVVTGVRAALLQNRHAAACFCSTFAVLSYA